MYTHFAHPCVTIASNVSNNNIYYIDNYTAYT